MQIQTGVYSLKEFCELLNISSYIWKKRKEDLLEHLKDYFDYTIELGGYHNTEQTIIIREVYDDYEPLPRKTNIKEKQQDYKEFTLETIKKEPLNTVSNIARKAVTDEFLANKYHHKSRAAENYIRPIINSDEILKGEKVWVCLNKALNIYELLQGEELETIQNIMREFVEKHDSVVESIVTSLDCGDLTEEEISKQVMSYLRMEYAIAIDSFVAKYGYRPFKVSYLIINGLVE